MLALKKDLSYRERLKFHVDHYSKTKEWNILDCYKHLDEDSIRAIQKESSTRLHVALLNIEGDLNIGVMIRSAALLGAECVHVIGRTRYDRRSTVGAHNYIPVKTFNCFHPVRETYDFFRIINYFQNNNLVPIFVEQGGICLLREGNRIHDTIDCIFSEGKYPCIVMGNESTGIPEKLIEFSIQHIKHAIKVSIPQRGVMRSYNVSSAFSILFWEISKRFF